ncbi:MAG: class I SAM-dependent methyltransferase [candidate division WOR-3 bacterium]|nr:MAG: class I SAM-dependent methyltransferase [candidate division WOR-3 bacterium]
MPRSSERSRRNLELASDLIAARHEAWDEHLLGQPFYLDMLDYLVDILELCLPPKARVIEISCGTGILAEQILRRLPGVRLVVTDISAGKLAVTRRRTARFRKRVTFIRKDNAACSFYGRYDAVCTTNAMRLAFVDYARLYRNFYRILDRAGIVLIGEAVFPAGRNRLLARIGDEINEAKTAPGSADRYSELVCSPGFTARVDKADILKKVRFYSPGFHIRHLRAAGFREAEVVYRKYHHSIIAGMKGRMKIRSQG